MRRRALKLVAVLAAFVLLAAACGDDDDEEAGTTTTESKGEAGDEEFGQDLSDIQSQVDDILGEIEQVDGETTRGVTRESIKIGGVTALTNAQGIEPFPGQCEGAKARFDRANREGGVNGRQIEYIACKDDGTDRDRNRQLMQAAVEDDEVFALLPVISQGFFAEDYLNEQHVPYLGFGFQPGYCGYERPFAFGTTGAVSCDELPDHLLVSNTLPGAYLAATDKQPDTVDVAAISEDAPTGVTGLEVVNNANRALGMNVVYGEHTVPPPTAPPVTDWTPFTREILAEEPNLVMIVTSDAPVIGLAGTLRASGYQGDIMNFVFSDERIFFVEQVKQALDGVITVNQGIGSPTFPSDSFKQISDDLAASGFRLPVTNGVLYGYGAADFFLAALEETAEPVTTESFTNTINEGFEYEGMGNALCPTTWPLQHLIGTPCASAVRINATGDGVLTGQGKGGFDPLADLNVYQLELQEKG